MGEAIEQVIDLVFYKEAINPDKLADELRAVLGDAFIEIVVGGAPRELHVKIKADMSSEKIDQARAVVDRHYPYGVEPEVPPDPQPPAPPAPGPGTEIIDLVYLIPDVNVELLDQELEAWGGSKYVGLSTIPGGVRVHVKYSIEPRDVEAVTFVVEQHDPMKETAWQIAQKVKNSLLDGLRKPWAEWTPEDKDKFLSLLAEGVIGS